MYSTLIIGNKYNIKTINNDEFEGIIKRIEPRTHSSGFIVIEDNWNKTISINLNYIVSFYELKEENVMIPSDKVGTKSLLSIKKEI